LLHADLFAGGRVRRSWRIGTPRCPLRSTPEGFPRMYNTIPGKSRNAVSADEMIAGLLVALFCGGLRNGKLWRSSHRPTAARRWRCLGTLASRRVAPDASVPVRCRPCVSDILSASCQRNTCLSAASSSQRCLFCPFPAKPKPVLRQDRASHKTWSRRLQAPGRRPIPIVFRACTLRSVRSRHPYL
jgi:hypothetical protein